MSWIRLSGAAGIVCAALSLAACTDSPTEPSLPSGWIEVDLSQYPNGGGSVPAGTVLADQWASIGIVFDSEPDGVSAIKEDWGGTEGSLFFSPDVYGAIAVFRFVHPDGGAPVDAVAFTLNPWFNAGESAQLVGLDASGAVVVVDSITADDIGSGNLNIEMSIAGAFRTVEWRTQGDPGIAAGDLAFRFR